MNRTLILLPLFFATSITFAQNSIIETDSPIQDFGVLENINNIRSEFIIKNNGAKSLYVLRADTKFGIKVRINNKTIAPGDTSTLYVFMEPKVIGKFNEEIKLITSADAQPYVLTIKGDIKSIKFDDKTACFYFNKSNKKNTPTQGVSIPLFNTSIKDTAKTKPVIIKDTPTEEVLDRRIYKSNNITFLIDVSSSMKDSLKLPLMKESMHAIISTLRDIDNVNIITYSDEARIIKQGVSGDNKKMLNKCVSELIAKGPTMGAQAILFSLDVTLHHYLEDGNNQLFLITDGKFKFTDEHYEQWKQKVGEKK